MKKDIQNSTEPEEISKAKLFPLELRVSESSQMYVIHKSIVRQLQERRQGSANYKNT